MNAKTVFFGVFLSFILTSCRKASEEPKPKINTLKITSPEFDGSLLFVKNNEFQIKTSEPAMFSAPDPRIKITAGGLINRLTSGEIVPITITSAANLQHRITVYALGATDHNHDEPYSLYHDYAASSTDPYSDYKKGWETLRKMPFTNETYALILRHADASVGSDDRNSAVPEWWKSEDRKLARQLNDRGIDRAIQLGGILKDLEFPITRLITSEYRRSTLTAELINIVPKKDIKTDERLNHPSYNKKSLFLGMTQAVKEQPVDNQITLIVAHHPMNELRDVVDTNFPKVMAFTWTGGYFVKVAPDKTLSFQGSVSYAMFRYWRDLKLNKL